METVREKPEMELDQGSVEQVRKLFNDYVVDPLGKELKAAESDIRSNEETQMGALQSCLETKLNGTNGRVNGVLQALGNPKDPLANLQSKLDDLGDRLENYLDDLHLEDEFTAQNETLENSLTSHLGMLQSALCGSLAENTAQLTEQSDADQKVVLERVAALEQQLLTALGDSSTRMTEYHNGIQGTLTAQSETLETNLTSHLETLQNDLCGSLAESTAQLTKQSDADQKAVLERVAALEQQLLTALGNSSTQMTEYRDDAKAELVEYQKTQQQFAVQKYKLLLGTSLAFGIVNFLGIVLLLYLNFMP